jgi:hypothetical protein
MVCRAARVASIRSTLSWDAAVDTTCTVYPDLALPGRAAP